MIRTGIIGNGYWGKIILSKLNLISQIQFIQSSSSYNPEMFHLADWIFVATPAETHFRIAKDVLLKRKNVFIEKPLCLNLDEAMDLFDLSKKNNSHIFIDNVFLERSELVGLKKKKYKFVKFIWLKNGPFNDSLINDLLYHDLYILIYLFGENDIFKINVILNEVNRLRVLFFYGNIKVEIDYDRVSRSLSNKSIYLDSDVVHFNKTSEDPLFGIISACLNNNANFEVNNKLNIVTTKIFLLLTEKIGDASK
jgi:hypothetical protein